MKPWDLGVLSVGENKRYLYNGEKPFFWLGDTAWLIFSRLTEEEAYTYLRNRKEKGYNVIQATLIHEWPQKNLEGDPALKEESLFLPDEESGYWTRAERIVDMAGDLGLYMALLPTWGEHVSLGRLNPDNMEHYLSFLVRKFGRKKNVIWLVGGDVKGSAAFEAFCGIGAYLKAHSGGALVGFHPFGRTSSSQWFEKEPWLDFYMFQSGHRRYDQKCLGAWDDNGTAAEFFGEDNWKYVERDLKMGVQRPTLDGEPSYEQILQGLHDSSQPYWQSWDTRRYAYWSVFAGACGHTFGDNSIMQFFVKERDKEGAFGVWQDWDEAMHNCGCMHMKHLKDLMEEIGFADGVSMQELTELREGYDRISVFVSPAAICCYDYSGKPFPIKLPDQSGAGEIYDGYWMDPVSGLRSYFGRVTGGEVTEFHPPKRLEGHSDWVLILKKTERK